MLSVIRGGAVARVCIQTTDAVMFVTIRDDPVDHPFFRLVNDTDKDITVRQCQKKSDVKKKNEQIYGRERTCAARESMPLGLDLPGLPSLYELDCEAWTTEEGVKIRELVVCPEQLGETRAHFTKFDKDGDGVIDESCDTPS